MNNKEYYLFLDDERFPYSVTWVKLPDVEWTIVRSYDEFINEIQSRGYLPKYISYDHDLASEHYVEYTAAHDPNSPTNGIINYNNFKEKTGYDCAKWLAQYCVDNNQPIPQYYVHTLNPIGGRNIISVLESAKKVIQLQ